MRQAEVNKRRGKKKHTEVRPKVALLIVRIFMGSMRSILSKTASRAYCITPIDEFTLLLQLYRKCLIRLNCQLNL